MAMRRGPSSRRSTGQPLAGWRLSLAALAAVAGLVSACDSASSDASADATSSDSAAGDGLSGSFDLNAELYPATSQSGATARMEVEAGGPGKDWHALPFPNDVRRAADGSLDLSGFPPPREGELSGFIENYLDHAKQELRGFSIQPTLYVQFDQGLSATAVLAPEKTLEQGGYFLINVDGASPDLGKLHPLRGKVSPALRGQHLFSNLLMLQPVWGKPLRPLTRYALVVRRSWKDAAGKPLGQPKALKDLTALWKAGKTAAAAPPELTKLAQSLEPLRAALQAGQVKVAYDDLAAATVFTTGNPTGQLQGMAQWVRSEWKPQATAEWKVQKKTKDFWLLSASYRSPNFQVGKCPYDQEGGFAFDKDGKPIVQVEETLRLSVLVPLERSADLDNRPPVVMSAHGTGGDYLSYSQGGKFKISEMLGGRGMVIVSTDQPMHGPRCQPEISGDTLDLKTFNFINISAGRSGFRQSALDTVAMTRLIREGRFDVPAEFSPDGKPVQLDGQRITFIGHSQGGLSGALAAAVEHDVRTFVLSGAGAGLSLTIMQRKDPSDIASLIQALLGTDPGELSEFHPLISLVQMLADITDPLSYAGLALQRPPEQRPPHILLTEGLLDQQTPSDTSEALASAMGLEILSPKVHLSEAMQLDKTKVLLAPVTGNLQRNGFAVTALVSQWDGLDHFAIFTTDKVARLYTRFLESTITDGEAVADFK